MNERQYKRIKKHLAMYGNTIAVGDDIDEIVARLKYDKIKVNYRFVADKKENCALSYSKTKNEKKRYGYYVLEIEGFRE